MRPKPKKTNVSDPTVIRVEIERSDGTITRLTAEEAVKWDQACNNLIAVAFAHGTTFPTLNWTQFVKSN